VSLFIVELSVIELNSIETSQEIILDGIKIGILIAFILSINIWKLCYSHLNKNSKSKTMKNKSSAFSLIELSIVLIIIGLLIAGITGGASLIKNSELRSVMGESRGYAVAVNGFYSQYAYLPGDYATAIAGAMASSTSTAAYGTSASSAQNGKIEYYTNSVESYLSESVAAWDQLVKTGTVDSTLNLRSLVVTTAQVGGTNMPSSKIKNAGILFGSNTFDKTLPLYPPVYKC
jgi:prepilin-type N-terminal cleavage/methylation domain-containing protein